MAKRTKKNKDSEVETVGVRINKPSPTTTNSYRVRQSDIQGAIYRPNEQKEILSNRASVIGEATVFTMAGKEDDTDENNNPVLWDLEYEDSNEVVLAEDRNEAYAKVVESDTGRAYFIKRGNNGHFYNPIGLYSEGNSDKKRLGLNEWKFERVNRKVFDFYLSFLRSKNKAWLVNAEREAT